MKKELGIYIHIPFCKQKCYYCDFVSYTNSTNYVEQYVEAVKNELKTYDLSQYEITTIYIGGGTPSYIEPKYISEIINTINSHDTEITIEVNPGTITKQKLETYKKCGINRLSIGLQTTNNKLLKQIGRIHTYKEFLETYNLARDVGFENINIDLIIGIPNQTMEDVALELEQILKLNPEHISVYSLIVEEGTPIEKMIENGELKLPSENVEREMYWKVKSVLEEHGYVHYEISNFAKPGKESKHNCNCWRQKEYIGLGVAAHSYLNKKRYANTTNLSKYIDDSTLCREILEVQQKEDEQKEYMLLGLRMIEGVSIALFKKKFGQDPNKLFSKEIEKLTNEGLIETIDDKIRLTNKGLDLANLVWEEFV